MQLSDQTLTILKNFTSINQSLIFKPGSILRTINPQKSVMAIAEIPDEIPSAACIYDVPRLLSVLSLFNNPDIEFGEKAFTISEGRRKTKYVYADPSMMIVPPEKEISVPSPDVTVSVVWDDISSVIKAAGVLQLPEIAFIGENGSLYLRAVDSSNPSADTFGVELVGNTDTEFTLILKTENLKLLPVDYTVSLSSKGISSFSGENIKYFVSIDSKSTFKKG